MRNNSIKKIMACITVLAFICAVFIPTVHSQLGKGFSTQSQQTTTTENTIQEKVNTCLNKYTETNSKTIKPNNPFPLDNDPPNVHLPTSQVTMKVFTTTTSYFRTLLSNVPAGYEVSNGNYTGWCSDSAHTINLNTPYQVTLYSSYYSSLPTHLYHQNWSKVNYILNHKIGSDWHQVQYAIVYLLNFGNQGLNTDGWAMVNAAITYGGSYVPGGGDIIVIIADAGATVQRTIFELTVPTYSLSTSVNGMGSITKDPDNTSYTYGQVIQLTANPAEGWSFSEWSGNLSGSTNPNSIIMTGNKAVTATFTLNGPYTLTLTTSGTGSGTIQASPSGPYYYGASVTIWANVSVGSTFAGFTGSLTGTTTPQTLVMNGNKAVNAQFTLNGPYTLTLTTSGTGSGTIQASPSGPYYYGASVTIWANVSVGSTFAGFTGSLTGTTTPQTLVMNGNKAVNAQFTLNGPYTLTLTTSGTGSGTIQASPSGPYYYGASVTIWANVSVGSTFAGFTGSLTGTTTPQTLVMNGNKAVNAQFTLNGPYTLTLTTSGTGSGTIQASPSGPYYYGASVTIWANVSVGSTFAGFTGSLTGTTTPQTLVMNGNKAVNAQFTLNGPYTLTLTTSGTGSGTIQASPSGPYYYGASVTIWANVSVGSTFAGFTGSLTGTTTPQTLVMNGNKAVNAQFTLNGPYTLTLTTSGTGSGTIQASPSGPYYYGASVTIWANVSVGSTFAGFTGSLTGTTTPQTLVMNENKAVNAQFTLQDGFTLTLTTSGTGSGTIQASPSGPYYYGTTVTIWANASTGSTFDGFTGSLTGTTTPQTLVMDGNKAVNAQFTLQGGYTLTITIQGSGTVTKVPDLPSYTYGQVVNLTANPAAGWVFNHWGGDLSGSTNPTTITMTANKAVTANFTQGGGDTTPPLVEIVKPINNGIYILNKFILPLKMTQMPIIVQMLTIEVNASDNESGINHVEFFIDGVLKGQDTSEPYSYDWKELLSGKHKITVKAFDNRGNSASVEILVFKWRLHPILILPILFLGVLWRVYS